MGKLVQIHDVPDDVHRVLKERAGRRGQSLSEYLRGELARSARELTGEELMARLERLPPVQTRERPDEMVRRARDERE